MNSETSIEKVSYTNAKQVRILKTCLETWFKNPKDLNLTAPNMRYPFNFNKWIADSYTKGTTRSFIIKEKDWVVGYMSLQLQPSNNFIHLFHVFIDRRYRGKGYGKLLIEKAISYAKNAEIPAITLFVKPNNQSALNLYESYGFKDTGEESSSGSPRLKLEF
jgi:ribosomal protein S18 acetylase RimI-like enzyme